MILAVIIGAIISGLFPLLFLPVFRRMEKERLEAAGVQAVKLAELEKEVQSLESRVHELRETAANVATPITQ
jgi:hypothetical protein